MSIHGRGDIAVALLFVWLIVGFVFRMVVYVRETGSSPFRGVSGQLGSLEWFGNLVFLAALFVGAPAAAWGALTGDIQPFAFFGSQASAVVGIALMIVGIVSTGVAQGAMGRSWRIGVDPEERTELVTDGMFGLVRNPIYTAFFITLFGLVLLVGNAIAIASLAASVIALEVQVRMIEEPYLVKTHGESYKDYAHKVGRFLPGIGRFTS